MALNNARAHANILFSKGCSSEEAQEEYMKIVKGWAGFGATMFDVVVSKCYLFNILVSPCNEIGTRASY